MTQALPATAQEMQALSTAIKMADHESMDRLLAQGKDYSQMGIEGFTPVFIACNAKDPIAVKKLLDYGLSPHHSGAEEDVSILMQVLMRTSPSDAPALINTRSEIIDLLLSAGADAGQVHTYGDYTTIMLAEHPDHLKRLLQHHPDLNIQDPEGDTVLHQVLTKIFRAQERNND